MENWADGNIMNVNKLKSQVLLLGMTNPIQQYLLRADQLQSNFGGKVLEVLLNSKFHMIQQCVLAIKVPNSVLGSVRRAFPASQGIGMTIRSTKPCCALQ